MIRSLPALLLVACVTETGNPELDVRLAVSGTSSDERVAVALTPATVVTGAWVVVDDVRLVEADGCETVNEVEHAAEGPFAVDLLAEAPFGIDLAAPATDYCRLRVDLDRADGEAGLPAAMDDHAVLLEGERADLTPFVLRSREKFEVELESAGAAFSLAEGRETLVLAFDLGAWLVDIGLDGAAPGGDGVVRVDEDTNEGVLEAFEARVEAALELYDDGDGDGRVGDDDGVLAD